MYNCFKNILTEEMDSSLDYKDYYPSRTLRKRFQQRKPYWNNELNDLWKKMKNDEKKFVRCQRSQRDKNALKRIFIESRNKFDRALRKAKRNYENEIQIKLDNLNTKNPKEFWNHIKSLGPAKHKTIPLEILEDGNKINSNIDDVLARWKNDFESLYKNSSDSIVFDNDFFQNVLLNQYQTASADTPSDNSYILNGNITYNEVERVLRKTKNNKALGIDNIPYEILKSRNIIEFLTKLFNFTFENLLMPSDWYRAIISPIPKNSSDDPRVPLNYRGISLLSSVYKVFSSVLNNRLVDFCESKNLLADEQNGFRQDRCCNDHLYALTTLIRARKSRSLSTFATFVDIKKAFD